MAETILLPFGKLILGQLGSLAVDELKLAVGLEDEVESIESNLSSIQAVLRDAEKQQRTSESIKNWLEKLEDVMYDIDDLLDDIQTEVKLRAKNKGELRKQVRKFFSRTNSLVLRSQWAHQIKSLSKKLDRISSERRNFALSVDESVDPEEPSSRETHSKPNKSDLILGRDDDKEAIINSILSCGDRDSLSVVPIVGIGGVGKTTLAQLVYNDTIIDDSFELKLWVYVSERFRIKKVMKQVISMVTGESIAQLTMEELPLESLRMKMSDALREKKYLLVLDDMWNEDSNEWRKLRELLDVGAKGSTVIVTTRGTTVASITHTVDECRLTELSHEDSLQIFKHLAFKDGDENIKDELLDLADEIVKMSKGHPLVVTTLGKLLHQETDEEKWVRVIQKLENGHEEILNVLKLSYDQLTSYSKTCFRFLHVFRDVGDQIMELFDMVSLWMALGYIPSDGQGEELGRRCIEELLSKSLITEDANANPAVAIEFSREFCMHDLVCDLAKSMSREIFTKINCGTEEVSEKVRYIILDEDELLGKQFHQRVLHQAKKIRLFLIDTPQPLSRLILEIIISSFPFLRVLHLNGCQFENLPRTIGYMKHLRHLNLRGNERIRHLPSSICNLINLLTLIFDKCSNLQKVPTEIGRLENLKSLFLTTHQEALPESVGNIKGLRLLSISDCPRLAFLPTSIKHLQNLGILRIFRCENLDLGHGSLSLEGLKNLTSLDICGVPKLHMLSMGTPFVSLKHVAFVNCEGLIELGEWTKYLISLELLIIKACPNLFRLPRTLPLLNNMKCLVIDACPLLSGRCRPRKGEDWPLISHIPFVVINNWVINYHGVLDEVGAECFFF